MAYKVKKSFRDKTNNRNKLKKGDFYQHEDADRIAFLIKEGYLEEKSKQPPELKHTGGGWYQLPNGEKVRTEEKALEALAKIESGE